MTKKIKVNQDNSSNVKVNINTKTYAGTIIEQLTELKDKDYNKILTITKKYRKANKVLAKQLGTSVAIKITNKDDYAKLVNDMVDLNRRAYRLIVRNSKRMRKTLKQLDRDLAERQRIEDEDRASRVPTGLSYEAY